MSAPRPQPHTRVACNACRAKKCRCDGTRPACSNCSLRSRICVYETRRADESRITALRRENGELRTALAEAISIAAKVAPDSSIQLSSFHTAPVADSPRCKSEPTQSDHAPSLSIPSSSLSSELGSAEPSPLLASPPAPDQKYGQSEIFTLYSQSGDSATIASASLGLNDACHHQPEHSFESNANATLDECHTLLEALVRNSDQESTLLLASLRLGYSIKAIADHLERNGGSSKGLVPSQRSEGFPESPQQEPLHFQTLPSVVEMHPSSHRVAKRFRNTDYSIWLPLVFNREMWMHSSPHTDFGPRGHQHASSSDGVAIHPSLLAGSGHLTFSDTISASYLSPCTQAWQRENIVVPAWSLQLLRGPASVLDPFDSILTELRADIRDGVNPETMCGPHAFIACLHDEDTFKRAPKLSKISASMVKSLKPDDPRATVTQYATMFIIWSLWTWLLAPSPQTYHDLPACMRPTPWQMFAPHSHVFDILFSPSLREHLCQSQAPVGPWLTEVCKTLRYNWPGTLFEALCRDGQSGELDLNPLCKAHVANSENWSLGTSVKQYLPNIGKFVVLQDLPDPTFEIKRCTW